MPAEIIDGRAIALQVRAEVREAASAWTGAGHDPPGVGTVLVGDDPASAISINGKQKASAEVGIRGFDHRMAHDVPHAQVRALLAGLNPVPAGSGVLLQRPTPPEVDGSALTETIGPAKDVDGLTPIS